MRKEPKQQQLFFNRTKSGMGKIEKGAISNQKISYQFLKVRNWYGKKSYQNLIAYTGWAGTKLKVSKTYNMIFSYTKYQWTAVCIDGNRGAISRKSWNISFFALVINFKPFQTHWTVLCLSLPIETTWNWVFLSETGKINIVFWENDMKPSISQWNHWKIEIMFWENIMKWSIS